MNLYQIILINVKYKESISRATVVDNSIPIKKVLIIINLTCLF
jgi:hypothetical protein